MFTMSLGTVILRITALVYMFIATTRFSVKHSIVNVLRKRYGKNMVNSQRCYLTILYYHEL